MSEDLKQGHIKLSPAVNKALTDMSDKRKKSGALVSKKQDIVQQLIMAQHKREVK